MLVVDDNDRVGRDDNGRVGRDDNDRVGRDDNDRVGRDEEDSVGRGNVSLVASRLRDRSNTTDTWTDSFPCRLLITYCREILMFSSPRCIRQNEE